MNNRNTTKFQSAAIVPEINLVSKLVEATGLTRREVTKILRGLEPLIFEQLKINPEKFIPEASEIINHSKAAQIIDGIIYTPLDDNFDIKIFYATAGDKVKYQVVSNYRELLDKFLLTSYEVKYFRNPISG